MREVEKLCKSLHADSVPTGHTDAGFVQNGQVKRYRRDERRML